jgi:hypothetical protein
MSIPKARLVGGVPALSAREDLLTPSDSSAAAAATLDPGFGYQGGPIISDPQVSVSFWGRAWQEASHSARRANLVQFVQDFLASNYMNILSQYGVGHGAGACGRYLGDSDFAPPQAAWEELDNNPATAAIVADGNQLYQRHNTGLIWRYTGTPLTGWQLLDNNPATAEIVADGNQLYQRHNTGLIWRYTGTPLTGWQLLDDDPASVTIVASAAQLYQRHNTGRIWRYTA